MWAQVQAALSVFWTHDGAVRTVQRLFHGCRARRLSAKVAEEKAKARKEGREIQPRTRRSSGRFGASGFKGSLEVSIPAAPSAPLPTLLGRAEMGVGCSQRRAPSDEEVMGTGGSPSWLPLLSSSDDEELATDTPLPPSQEKQKSKPQPPLLSPPPVLPRKNEVVTTAAVPERVLRARRANEQRRAIGGEPCLSSSAAGHSSPEARRGPSLDPSRSPPLALLPEEQHARRMAEKGTLSVRSRPSPPLFSFPSPCHHMLIHTSYPPAYISLGIC